MKNECDQQAKQNFASMVFEISDNKLNLMTNDEKARYQQKIRERKARNKFWNWVVVLGLGTGLYFVLQNESIK